MSYHFSFDHTSSIVVNFKSLFWIEFDQCHLTIARNALKMNIFVLGVKVEDKNQLAIGLGIRSGISKVTLVNNRLVLSER